MQRQCTVIFKLVSNFLCTIEFLDPTTTQNITAGQLYYRTLRSTCTITHTVPSSTVKIHNTSTGSTVRVIYTVPGSTVYVNKYSIG